MHLEEGLENLVILDASWHMPQSGRIAVDEYVSKAIPNAAFFDIDAVSDKSSDLPHMLPANEIFRSETAQLGILSEDTNVVVYDSVGVFSAPRCWWMMRAFGHKRCYILDGGLPQWICEGRSIVGGKRLGIVEPCVDTRPKVKLDKSMVINYEDIKNLDKSSSAAVIDARSAERFFGKVAEPRKGLRSGSIPGSYSLPFDSILEKSEVNGVPVVRFSSPERIRSVVESSVAGYEGDNAFVTTCGSGVTACVLAAGLEIAGLGDSVRVYDGSWTEYGSKDDIN